jgi:hypothetical protein
MLIQPSSMNSSSRELYFLFGVSFFGKASKTFKSERGFETADGTDLQEETSKLSGRNFKGLSPSITPLERESLHVR